MANTRKTHLIAVGDLIPRRELTGISGPIAAKYGKHADDQWTVDELLAHARGTDAEETIGGRKRR
jgi:hypothetical protein